MKRSYHFSILLVFVLFLVSNTAFAQYKLHVGESKFLEVPDAPNNGYINNSIWTSDVGVAIEPGDNTYGAIIRVTKYFSGTVTVHVSSTYTYYDYRGWPLGGQFSKSWVISCIPINVSLEKTDLKLKMGEKATIKTFYPSSDAGWMNDVKYQWEIGDDWIASLDVQSATTSVKVKGEHPGKTVITLDPIVGPIVKCNVTVVTDPPQGILIEPQTLTLRKGQTGNLSCVFTPSDTYAEVTWNSSDHNIAKVSSRGVVTAVAAGSATITATTDGGLTATTQIEVAPDPTKVNLDGPKEVAIGYTISLSPILQPSNAEADFSWTVDDFTIGRIEPDGRIKGISPGKTNVNVKTNNGLTASYEISVYDPMDDMRAGKVKSRIGVLKEMVYLIK